MIDHHFFKADAIVIGAGPAGIVSSLELIRLGKKVLLLDTGLVPNKNFFAKLQKSKEDELQTGSLGGVSKVWGGQVGTLLKEDFSKWLIESEYCHSDQNILSCYVSELIQELNISPDIYFRKFVSRIDSTEIFLRRTSYLPEPELRKFQRELLRSPNFRFLDNTHVTKLSFDNDRVRSIHLEGQPTIELIEGFCILAGGTMGTTEILLKSNINEFLNISDKSPNFVGKNLCDHPHFVIGRFYKKSFDHFPLKLSAGFNKKYKSKNIFVVEGRDLNRFSINVEFQPINGQKNRFPKQIIYKNSLSALRKLLSFIFTENLLNFLFAQEYQIWIQLEQANNPKSAIKIQSGRTSSEYCLSELDFENIQKLLETLEKVLSSYPHELISIKSLEFLESIANQAAHPSGTIRMNSQIERGIVDNDGIFHAIRNLGIASAAIFPVSGWINPTLIIMAHAKRVARRLSIDEVGKRNS